MKQIRENFRNFQNHHHNDDDNKLLRLFFYVNSLILLTISWRAYERDEFKHFIVYHIRQFNKSRKKAKKLRKTHNCCDC